MLYLSERFKDFYNRPTEEPNGAIPQLPTMYDRRYLIVLDTLNEYYWDEPNNTWVLLSGLPKTDDPELNGPTEANENTDVDISILNYSSTATYTITVTHGTYTRNGSTITWSLPFVSSDTNATLTIKAKEDQRLESNTVDYDLLIKNVALVDDQVLVYDNTNFDNEFSEFYNMEVGSIYSNKGLGNILDTSYTSTTTEIYIDNKKAKLEVGDILETEDGTTFTVQAINNDGTISEITDVKMLSFGGGYDSNTHKGFTMLIKSDGSLWATGDNTWGQLGLGDTTNRSVFTPVGIAAKKVVCGYGHAVIIKDNGEAWVAGNNGHGQLGLGDTTDRHTFTFVGRYIKDVSCTAVNTIFQKYDGTLWGCGYNYYGELGLGDNNPRTSPVQMTNYPVEKFDGGEAFTAIIVDGRVYTTGQNSHGQLAVGDTNNRNTFTDTGFDAIDISIGQFQNFARKSDGTWWACGDNNYGELGLGNNTEYHTYQNTGITAERIFVGGDHTVALMDDGSVWTTGGNGQGQLGLGDNTDRNTFTDTGMTGVSLGNAGCGSYMSGIIKEDGSLFVCGYNTEGSLGLGDTNNRNTFTDTGEKSTWGLYYTKYWVTPETALSNAPTEEVYFKKHRAKTIKVYQDDSDTDWYGISNGTLKEVAKNVIDENNTSTTTEIYINNEKFEAEVGDYMSTENGEVFKVQAVNNDGSYQTIDDVVSVASGFSHTMIIRKDGFVWATGANNKSQLGLGDTNNRNVFVNTGIKAVAVACGYEFSAVIKSDGTVWTVGDNTYGQLGLGDTNQRNSFTNTGIKASKITSGTTHLCIQKEDGTVWGTGYNAYGQLGLGDTNNRTSFEQLFTDVSESGIVKSISAGANATFIVDLNDELYVTGLNGNGQLGLGDTTDRHSFTDTGLTVKKAYCGYYASAIITNDNSLFVTGYNGNGQLGLGDTNDRHSFTDTGLEALTWSCGGYHSLIVKPDYTVWGTGDNDQGELGVGDNTDKSSFTASNTTAKDVKSGGNHTMIIKNDGTIWGAGYNAYGQLGLGDNTNRNTFTDAGFTAYYRDGFYTKYWVTPETALNNAPQTAVYPISSVRFNNTDYEPLSTSVSSGIITQTIEEKQLNNQTREIRTTLKSPDKADVQEIRVTLQKVS